MAQSRLHDPGLRGGAGGSDEGFWEKYFSRPWQRLRSPGETEHDTSLFWPCAFIFFWILAIIFWIPLLVITVRYFRATKEMNMMLFHDVVPRPYPVVAVTFLCIAFAWWFLMLCLVLSKAYCRRIPITLLGLGNIVGVVGFAYVLGYYATYFSSLVDCSRLKESTFDTCPFAQGTDLSFYQYGLSSKSRCKDVKGVIGLCGVEVVCWFLMACLLFWLAFKIKSSSDDAPPDPESAPRSAPSSAPSSDWRSREEYRYERRRK